MINKSKIPWVEFHLECQKDDKTIRSFIDTEDHLQFRCKCDEWYEITIELIWEDNIYLKLECPLCRHEEQRKIYINRYQPSLDEIENFIMAFDFSQWNKKEAIRYLGLLRYDIKTLLEDMAQKYGLNVPTEEEEKEQYENIMKRYEQTVSKEI